MLKCFVPYLFGAKQGHSVQHVHVINVDRPEGSWQFTIIVNYYQYTVLWMASLILDKNNWLQIYNNSILIGTTYQDRFRFTIDIYFMFFATSFINYLILETFVA